MHAAQADDKHLMNVLDFHLRDLPQDRTAAAPWHPDAGLHLPCEATLGAYLLYRAAPRGTVIPLEKASASTLNNNLQQEPDCLTLQILHRQSPFFEMDGEKFSFLQSCVGSFLHSVTKDKSEM